MWQKKHYLSQAEKEMASSKIESPLDLNGLLFSQSKS